MADNPFDQFDQNPFDQFDSKKDAPERDWIDEAVDTVSRGLGLTVRAGARGVSAIPALASDAIGGALNLGSEALGFETRFPTNHMGTVDEALDAVGVPRPETRGEKIGTGAAEFLAGAGAGVGLGKAMQGTRSATAQGVGATLADEPGRQAAAAAAAGAAGGTTDDPTLSTILSLTAGVLAGSKLKMKPEAEKISALAKKEGVPLSAGDLGNRYAKSVEDGLLADKLSGRSQFLMRQNKALQDAVGRAMPSENAEPVGDVMVRSLRAAFDELRRQERGLYDAVKKRLASPQAKRWGIDNIPINRSKSVLSELAKEYDTRILDPNNAKNSVKKTLENILQGEINAVNYDQFLTMRSSIGSRARELRRSGDYTMAGDLERAYKALSADLDDWGKILDRVDAPTASVFRRARDFSKNRIMPYRDDPDVRSIVSSKATDGELQLAADRIYRRLQAAPNKAERMMGFMEPQGQTAARTQVMRDMQDAATLPDPGTNSPFSPTKLRNTVNAKRPVTERILTPEQQKRMDELATLSGSTTRSPQGFNTPQTGFFNRPAMMSGGVGTLGYALGGWPGALVGAAAPRVAGMGVRPALQTQAAQRFMNSDLARSSLPTANPGTLSLIEQLTRERER